MSAAEIEQLVQQADALNLIEVIDPKEDDNLDSSIQIIGGKVVNDRRRNRKKKFHEQYLQYVICVDFEATCWERRILNANEIIGG